MRWEITAESTRRKEILELSEVALCEAIINSVCHRDYTEEGANIMVEIFDDRVEIYNPGGLQEKDFGHRSVCRNPNIAVCFFAVIISKKWAPALSAFIQHGQKLISQM